MPAQSRRSFAVSLLSLGSGLALAPAARGVDAFQRPGAPRLKLGLAAYSFRNFFAAGRSAENRPPSGKTIDLFEFIDYCADHDCDGAELTSYYFPESASAEYLLKLKRHAFLRGIDLSGTAIGNTFTPPPGEKRQREIALLKRWVDNAALMGMPHIRVFAGSAEDQPLAQAKRNCIDTLAQCCEYAGQKGIFLGVENHGGIVAEPGEMLEIVKTVQSPWLGINLDTGNFHTDDPYADLEKCAPYAVNVQIKTEIRPRRGAKQEADLARLVKILKAVNYQGYVVLEYEAEDDAYAAVPGILRKLKELL